MTIELVTRKAGYKRITFYSHIKQEDLSFKILEKYARALGHDFSEDIPGMNPFIVEDEGHGYSNEPTLIEEAIKQRNEWKEKYYTLLEKYLMLVEKEKK